MAAACVPVWCLPAVVRPLPAVLAGLTALPVLRRPLFALLRVWSDLWVLAGLTALSARLGAVLLPLFAARPLPAALAGLTALPVRWRALHRPLSAARRVLPVQTVLAVRRHAAYRPLSAACWVLAAAHRLAFSLYYCFCCYHFLAFYPLSYDE